MLRELGASRLKTGEKMLVKETPEEVVGRVIEYARRLRVVPEAS